ncbi:MAG: SsrA-binding protein SmpB [Magnetococcales bacterium]|nr:SsrA-binding protein SmpB [Magnetococcales bacterium]NGZ25712.1 SsrA-binding protein SmpB [Magnetococcales bacterium]
MTTISDNRKARFNYEILETFEAGIVLLGTEIKSIRSARLNLNDAYAIVQHNELFLLNAHISPYSHGNQFNHDPLRTRKLLVHGWQIRRLTGSVKEKGVALIPTRAYWKNGRVKIEIGIGKGKQLHDKRQTIKEREWAREKSAILKGGGD